MKFEDKNIKKVFIMPRIEEKILNRAKKVELKVLYYIFSHDGEIDTKTAVKALDETEDEINLAIAFWRGTGIISHCENENESQAEGEAQAVKTDAVKTEAVISEKESTVLKTVKTDESKTAPSSYTLLEIASARDRNAEFASLVDYMEKLTGKQYNSAEQGIVLYLYDTLGINYELIMGIANYCVSKGKSSIRYIQKTVMSIHDEGVSTYTELEAYLQGQKNKEDYRGMVKKIIGVDRAFTKQECVQISSWEKKGYSGELVNLAYERTVAAINKPQITYMGKILDSWYDKDLKTLAEVEEYMKNAPSKSNNSSNTSNDGRLDFNLEDIFEKP